MIELDLKPGDLRLSQDLSHHDWLTPDSVLSFSSRCVGVIGILLLSNGDVDINTAAM